MKEETIKPDIAQRRQWIIYRPSKIAPWYSDDGSAEIKTGYIIGNDHDWQHYTDEEYAALFEAMTQAPKSVS